MRKVLFALALIVLIIFTGIVIYKGTGIGDIWGVTQITAKNDDIDRINSQLTGLVEVTYPSTLKKLNDSTETLQQTKKEYEDQAILLANSKYYRQTETYKLEFLWTKLGNYAKDDNVIIKIDVTNGDAKGIYNLNFTVTGKYSDVTQFIYDIENDSILGFRIDDFDMTGGSSISNENGTYVYSVNGKFTCKDIRLDIKAIEGSTAQPTTTTTNTNTKTNTTNSNTTNTTTNNTTNTANTTNSDMPDEAAMMSEANAVNGNTVQ